MMKKLVSVGSAIALALSLSACVPVQSNYRQPTPYQNYMAEAKAREAGAKAEQAKINREIEAADAGAIPRNYQFIARKGIKDSLKDPDSAKISAFTKPKKDAIYEDSKIIYGYSTCATVNAKNSYGGYTGNHVFWVFIKHGVAMRVNDTDGDYGNLIFVNHFVSCS